MTRFELPVAGPLREDPESFTDSPTWGILGRPGGAGTVEAAGTTAIIERSPVRE